jgi:hypothetical protein
VRSISAGRACRLVGGRADSDPSQPLVACHHLSAHIRREINKVAGAQRNLFSACPQYAAARDPLQFVISRTKWVLLCGGKCFFE